MGNGAMGKDGRAGKRCAERCREIVHTETSARDDAWTNSPFSRHGGLLSLIYSSHQTSLHCTFRRRLSFSSHVTYNSVMILSRISPKSERLNLCSYKSVIILAQKYIKLLPHTFWFLQTLIIIIAFRLDK